MSSKRPKSDLPRRSVLVAGAGLAASGLIRPALADTPTPPRVVRPRLTLRRSADRGTSSYGGWLKAKFTFSFAGYHDPQHMGFRALRVMNEDRIAGGGGFPMHPHDNMEILTYVLAGALRHKDSLGNGGIIKPGEVQRMSAGTGIRHSEFNPSATDETHLMQIWMLPARRGIQPSYEQQRFTTTRVKNKLQLLASPTARDGSVLLQSSVDLYGANLERGAAVDWTIKPGRHVWIQIAKGSVQMGPTTLKQGDGARSSEAGTMRIKAREDAEILIFDLA